VKPTLCSPTSPHRVSKPWLLPSTKLGAITQVPSAIAAVKRWSVHEQVLQRMLQRVFAVEEPITVFLSLLQASGFLESWRHIFHVVDTLRQSGRILNFRPPQTKA